MPKSGVRWQRPFVLHLLNPARGSLHVAISMTSVVGNGASREGHFWLQLQEPPNGKKIIPSPIVSCLYISLSSSFPCTSFSLSSLSVSLYLFISLSLSSLFVPLSLFLSISLSIYLFVSLSLCPSPSLI